MASSGASRLMFSLFVFVVAIMVWFGFETGSLCGPGWPGMCYVDQAGSPRVFLMMAINVGKICHHLLKLFIIKI